jgi:alkylation response protein AidB-like acyl-CoA dehydrogenase
MPRHVIDKDAWGGAAEFDSLLADIRARRKEFEQQKYISQDVIERFKSIGVYRALVPKRYGGDEKSPIDFLLMVEEIAAADGSAGWVASFGMNPAYLAALPPQTVEKVWANGPDVVFAGGIFPPQPAQKVDGGYLVNGRWQFGSGCMGASVCGVGIMPDDGQALPRMAVVAREYVKIEPAWDVIGLIGTGSHDLVVENVVVPEEWTFTRGGAPTVDAPFFRYPSLAFAAQVLSVVTLGLAREALDVIQSTAASRTSVTGAPNIGDRPYVQIEVAKAEAKVRSSRAFFYEATEDAWAAILAGGRPTPHQTSMIRLAATNLTHECAEAVRIAYQLSGMTSTYNDHPLSQLFRDAAMCTQHAFMGAITYQNAGAMFFGKQPLPGYL